MIKKFLSILFSIFLFTHAQASVNVGVLLNNLLTQFESPTAPITPANYQYWINTTSIPYVLNIYDGTTWVPVGKLNPSSHTWTVVGTIIGSSTSLAGGTPGATPYQISTGNTGFIAAGSPGNVYTMGVSGIPEWDVSSSSYNPAAVAITGGTIDGVVIGGSTPGSISGTTLSASGQITSTVSTGTAPLLISSTTPVANLSIGGNAATATNVDYSGLTGSVPTWNQNTTGTAAHVTTNANLTGPITSVGNATSVASQTGTGSTFVMQASPTLTTPNLGTPSALVGTNISGTASGLSIGGNAATATSSTTSTTATNIIGGAAGSLPYQTGSGSTTMLATASGVLVGGSTPSYSTAPTLTGTNFSGTASSLTAGTVTTNANLTGDTTSVGNATTTVAINGTNLAGLSTGILKNTTTTGIPSIAIAADFPTLNQSTTGNATTSTTTTNITGGAAGSIPYQTGSGATTMLATSTGVLVGGSTPSYSTAPTLTGTNFSGTASGLTAGTVTTNANLTGPITSSGNATSIAAQTGTGTKFVVDTSPTLVTPTIGAATGTSLSVSGSLTSTVATGTAPLVVTSTTQVANLNAATAGSSTTSANITGGGTNQIPYQTGAGATGFISAVNGALLNTNSSGVPAETATPVLGINGTTTGTIGLATSTTSGATTTIQPSGITSAVTITLPASTGTLLYSGGALGTPSSGVATNLTGTAASLTSGTVTTNANLTGVITSSGNATSIASQTGTGTKFVTDTSPTLVTPVIGAATGTSLSVSGGLTTTAGTITPHYPNGIVGITTGSAVTAGSIGETITATGTSVSVSNASQKTITSITLSAGNWLIIGTIRWNPAGGTTMTTLEAGISNTNNSLPSDPFNTLQQATFSAGSAQIFPVPSVIVNVTGTPTYYLVADGVFAGSTMTCSANITAIRIG